MVCRMLIAEGNKEEREAAVLAICWVLEAKRMRFDGCLQRRYPSPFLFLFCSPCLCERLFAGCLMRRERRETGLFPWFAGCLSLRRKKECIVLAICFVNGLLSAMSQRLTFGNPVSMLSVVSLKSFFASVSVCVSKDNAGFNLHFSVPPFPWQHHSKSK